MSQNFSAFAHVPVVSCPATGSLKMSHFYVLLQSKLHIVIDTNASKTVTVPCLVKSVVTDINDGANVLRSRSVEAVGVVVLGCSITL